MAATATTNPPAHHWNGLGPDEAALAHIPGTKGLPMVGSTLQLLADPIKFTQDMANEFGYVYRTRVFGDWSVSLLGADANELVLRNRDQVFSNEHGWAPILDLLFPNSLMLTDFEAHRIDRRALAPAFAPSSLQHYADALNAGIAREVSTWSGDRTFYPAIKQLALVLAAESFVGVPWGTEAKQINEAFVGAVQASVAPIRKPLPYTAMKRGVDGRAFLVEYFTAECERRRREGGGNDIFSQFATATREDGSLLEVSEVVDQIIFLMMAAHDTITSSTTSVIDMLGRHPEWQNRVREEIWSVTGKPPHPGAPLPLSYEDFAKLPTVEMVFKESLRVRPPLPSMPRQAVKDFSFGGFDLPAGTRIGIDIHYTHHDERYWDSPDTFDPERFTPENEATHTDFAWVPFGGGAHKCLGLRFADMQIKLMLTHILGRYEIQSEPGYAPKWQIMPIQRPKDGLKVRLQRI